MLTYFKEEMQMAEQTRRARELDALELIAAELERLLGCLRSTSSACDSSTTPTAAVLTCPKPGSR
jgi:hypothetical protein